VDEIVFGLSLVWPQKTGNRNLVCDKRVRSGFLNNHIHSSGLYIEYKEAIIIKSNIQYMTRICRYEALKNHN
jgi:hypothetical protein